MYSNMAIRSFRLVIDNKADIMLWNKVYIIVESFLLPSTGQNEHEWVSPVLASVAWIQDKQSLLYRLQLKSPAKVTDSMARKTRMKWNITISGFEEGIDLFGLGVRK